MVHSHYQPLLPYQSQESKVTKAKQNNQPKKPVRKNVTKKLIIRAAMKSGFYRCGLHFKYDEDTVLVVVARPVTRNQVSIAVANKLKAERMLIVKEG
jgi:hypothetical protein